MPRDPVAQPIQGPDNGSGNPLAVNATPVGTTPVNLIQVASTTVASVTIAGITYQRVALADHAGSPLIAVSLGSNELSLVSEHDGNESLGIQSAAGLPAVITIIPLITEIVRVHSITCNFFNANVAVNLTMVDGVAQQFLTTIPAAQAVPLHFPFPGGGLRAGRGNTVTITLPAGGAGVFANLSASWKRWP